MVRGKCVLYFYLHFLFLAFVGTPQSSLTFPADARCSGKLGLGWNGKKCSSEPKAPSYELRVNSTSISMLVLQLSITDGRCCTAG